MIKKSIMNWMLVYVKPGMEKRVMDALHKKSIHSYRPQYSPDYNKNSFRKDVPVGLFGPYLFVQLSQGQEHLVKKVSGIINFVYWLNNPVVVQDQDISAIKSFLTEHDTIDIEKIQVNARENMTITRIPFMQKDEKLVRIKHHTTKISLPAIGYTLSVKLGETSPMYEGMIATPMPIAGFHVKN